MNSKEQMRELNWLKVYTFKSLKRFDEQKGIIDSYVQRERDWKKDKLILNKEITKLKK